MSTSVIATTSFWRELLDRAGRQAAQVALPIVAAVSAAGGGLHPGEVAAVLGVAVAVTFLKALAGLSASPAEPLGWRLLDRALPAAAGVALGFIPVDLAGVGGVDWSAVGYAAGAAAVTSLLAYYVTPPSVVPVAVVPVASVAPMRVEGAAAVVVESDPVD